MKRLLVALAILALAATASAQPIPTGALRKVTTDSSFTGVGTVLSVLKLRTCTTGQSLKSSGTTYVCATAVTDDGTTWAITTNKFTVTEASGNTLIAGTLNANGNTTIGDANSDTLTLTAKINSKPYFTGTAPTPTSCGTTPSVAGNDVTGKVTLGSGTATSCTIPFVAAHTTNAPACVITSMMATHTDLYISAMSASSFTLANGAAANMAGGAFTYFCPGNL